MQKTSAGVAKKVKQDLLDGMMIKDIAEKYGISRNTVTKIKKEVDASDMSTLEKTFVRTHNITLPPRLQGKISEVDYYRATLEDSEEGWLVHAKQGSVYYEGSGMFFVGIVYGETIEELIEMMKQAEAKGLKFGYIFHKYDYWDHDSPEVWDGDVLIYAEGEKYKRLDPKKLHAHVLMQYESSRSWTVNQRIVNEIFGLNTLAWQVAFDPAAMWQYFLHRTPKAQSKHQYAEAERVSVNGFSIEPTKAEKTQMMAEINHWILYGQYAETGRYEYADLARKYDGQPMMLSVIRGNGNHFAHMIDSLRSIGAGNIEKLSDSALQATQEDLRERLRLCDAEIERRSKRSK